MQRSLKIASVAVAVLTASALLYTGLKKKPEAPVTQPVVHKAAKPLEMPSSHYNAIMYGASDTIPGWSSCWRRNATGTISSEIHQHETYSDSQIVLAYQNEISIYEYGADRNAAYQWLIDRGHHAESLFAHFSSNTVCHPPYNDAYCASYPTTFRPGWDVDNDQDHNWIRDRKAKFNTNYDVTRFTIGTSTITDAHGGWTTNEWQNQYCRLGWGSDADTVSFTISSNTGTVVTVSGTIPSHSYTYYLLDQAAAVNHNAVAMSDTLARIPFYCYCDSDKANNTPLVNFAMPDVQAYFTHTWTNYCRAWRAYADSYSTGITVGIFGDNREPDAPPDIIGWEYIGGGMENIDIAELQTQVTWTAAESTFSIKLRDSLHTINNCILVGNIGDRYCMEGYYPQWCHCAWGFDGWLFEGKMDVDGLSLSEVALLKQDVELKNSWGKQVWYFPKNSCGIPGLCGSDSTAYQERFLAFMGFYFAIAEHRNQHSASANFIFPQTGHGYPGPGAGYGVQTNDTLGWYWQYVSFNLGYPVGTDSFIDGRVYTQRYDHGFVAFKPWNVNGPDTITIDLGDTLHLVRSDGTLDPATISSYTMANVNYSVCYGAMGRLFGSTKESNPPAQPSGKKRLWLKKRP